MGIFVDKVGWSEEFGNIDECMDKEDAKTCREEE